MNHLVLFIFFTVFSFLPLIPAELDLSLIETGKTKERVLVLPGKHVIYFFSDNTLVYLRPPPSSPRQSWSDWWNETPPPSLNPQFYFDLTHWNVSSSFNLYQYQWNHSPNTHDLENLFNQSKIASEYPYFIENCDTGEMTLCQIWSLKDLGTFIIHYGEERYNAGYCTGFSTGRN